MTRTVHLVVGPDEHGVVRHGRLVADACGDQLVRAADPSDIGALPPCDVVHVPFTDRLFGRDAGTAGARFAAVARQVADTGAALSVTLHDVPHDDSPLQLRRRELYDTVIAAARGVVVNSAVELALVEDRADDVHSLRLIRLPIEAPRPGTAPARLAPGSVVVLGFVFPDRGYEQVIAALPAQSTLVALGRPAAGHEQLVDRYAAAAQGRFEVTGFVPDDQLAGYLAAAPVPVAPNRRVTASASINTWLALGRRPLVPDSPYAREVLVEHPGSLIRYDPDDPDDLAARIAAAVSDPALTRLDAPVAPTGPALGEQYRRHFAACRPPRAVPTARGHVVPGNRVDLLVPAPAPAVSVVVAYYDAQHDLDLVLTALAHQTHRDLEVLVVDDGSPQPPDVRAAGELPVRVLRQDDRGFRAARARNLGAAAAGGEVLVFLDGDTVPEPDFVAALAGRAASGADVLAVGRRRHADLERVGSAELLGRQFTELPEPGWLREAYARTADLRHADRRSYRFVISAVLGLRRELFDTIGGFDERFVSYGGEDWELAHRAWTAGAVLVHEPTAIAWHDGPDWAARGDAADRAAAKRVETATLAALLPDPDSRGAGRWWPYPSVVVRGGTLPAVDALATVRSAFAAGADCAFWFDELTGPVADLVSADPGVTIGAPPADVVARAWCRVTLHGPADLAGLMALADLAERHGTITTPAVTATSARAAERSRRHAPAGTADEWSEWLFGRHDRTTPALHGGAGSRVRRR